MPWLSRTTEPECDDVRERETLPPPTVPEPRRSEVRVRVRHTAATVDLVVADLRRDPRSEDYDAGLAPRSRARASALVLAGTMRSVSHAAIAG